MQNENKYQQHVIKRVQETFPGSIVLKNDANYIQGIPDLMVLHHDRWAALECKRSASAKHQPNQDYYVSTMNEMSYSAFVYPENEEEVFDGLARALQPGGEACVP